MQHVATVVVLDILSSTLMSVLCIADKTKKTKEWTNRERLHEVKIIKPSIIHDLAEQIAISANYYPHLPWDIGATGDRYLI